MKMNTTHTETRTTRRRGHLPALALALLVAVGSAMSARGAVTAFWHGQGSSANWSDSANWDDDATVDAETYTPINGDSLRWFPSTAGNKSSTNDIVGLSVAGISFQSGSTGNVLNGNKLTLTGTITQGGVGPTFNLPLELNNNSSIEGGTGANVLTINGDITEIGGARGVNGQSGNVALYGANSFSGNIIIGVGNNVTWYINTLANTSTAQSLGKGALIQFGHTGNNGTLIYNGSGGSTDKGFQIGRSAGTSTGTGGFINNGSGAVVWSGTQTKAGANVNQLTFTLGGTNTGNNDWQSVIANNSTLGLIGITKADAGKWILSGNNTYDGATTITGGTLLINGNQSGATNAVSVQNGGALGGSGTVGGAVTLATGGALKPYDTGSGVPSKLMLDGGFAYSAGTLDLSALATLAPGTHVLAEFQLQAVGTFAAFIGLPSGATVGYSATQITIKSAPSGTVVMIR